MLKLLWLLNVRPDPEHLPLPVQVLQYKYCSITEQYMCTEGSSVLLSTSASSLLIQFDLKVKLVY